MAFGMRVATTDSFSTMAAHLITVLFSARIVGAK